MTWILENLASDLAEFKNVSLDHITKLLCEERNLTPYFDKYFGGAHITEKTRLLYSRRSGVE